jgi:hypothetical protein
VLTPSAIEPIQNISLLIFEIELFPKTVKLVFSGDEISVIISPL